MPTLRRVRLLNALGAALIAAGVCARARADGGARLEYTRGPGAEHCPDAAELERAVSRGLGENPFEPSAARAYQVRILAGDGGLVGHVALLDASGAVEGLRRFDSSLDRCDELVAALALAIGITINPELALAPPAQAPAEAAPEAPPAPEVLDAAAQTPKRAAVPAAPKSSRDERASVGKASSAGTAHSGLELGLEAHAALGSSPALSGGVGAFGRLRVGAFSGALEGRYDAPASRQLLEGTVYSTLIGASAVPCFHFGPAFACGVLFVGNMTAGSDGVSNEQTDSGIYVAGGPRLGFGIEMGEAKLIRLEGRWDGLFAVTPVSVVLNGESVWEGPPVSATFGAAAAWLVP